MLVLVCALSMALGARSLAQESGAKGEGRLGPQPATQNPVTLYYYNFHWNDPRHDVCTPVNNWCGHASPAPKAVIYGTMYTTVTVPVGSTHVDVTIHIPCNGWGEGLHGPAGSAGVISVDGAPRFESIDAEMSYHHDSFYRYEYCQSFTNYWRLSGQREITLTIEMRGGAILDFQYALVAFSAATATPTATPSPTATPVPRKLYLPLALRAWCAPGIAFSYVPPYGSFDDLQGRVTCVDPACYQVAVYILVSGWWNKPTWASPLTPIRADGTWTCDITTGGTGQLATKIVAFLVPNGYTPPQLAGEQTLPAELLQNAVASVQVEREATFRRIQFSGYTWKVKASETPAGPGPNYFSDRAEDVWVDDAGRLHLRIVARDGKWYCTEVFTETPFGYGKYVYRTGSRIDQLDPQVVLGLFTWDDTAPQYHYREIDIEFSRWGDPLNQNGQYVVSPWDQPGHIHRFEATLRGDQATHCFVWRAGGVSFQSLHGRQACPGAAENEIASWSYVGADTPPAGQGNARINLWLYNGAPPTDGQPAEVIIDGFEFVPE
jgi:hypothetical protein